jgi:hypothetical protein
LTKRLLFAGVLALSCAVLVAGCGSSGGSRLSAHDYTARLASIGKEADKAQTAVEQALRATTVGEIHTRLGNFADADDRIGDEIAKLRPPKNGESANAELAKGEHDLASEVHALLPEISKQKAAKAALATIQKSLGDAAGAHEIDEALTRLKKLGYTKSG